LGRARNHGLGAGGDSELLEHVGDVVFDRMRPITKASAIWRWLRPPISRRSTSTSRGLSVSPVALTAGPLACFNCIGAPERAARRALALLHAQEAADAGDGRAVRGRQREAVGKLAGPRSIVLARVGRVWAALWPRPARVTRGDTLAVPPVTSI